MTTLEAARKARAEIDDRPSWILTCRRGRCGTVQVWAADPSGVCRCGLTMRKVKVT